MPFTLSGWATGSSPSGPQEPNQWIPDPLMGFGSPSEDAQAPSRRPEPPGYPGNPTPDPTAERQLAAPPLRFRPLQRFPSPGQRHEWPGLHSRPPAPSGSRNLLAPSSAPSLPGLVPCRIRSWGHPPELSSSHAAARCFQRRSPLGVPTAFRVLLRARVRFPVQLFKLKTGYVALLGLFPSRVFNLSALARPSPVLPSCGCS